MGQTGPGAELRQGLRRGFHRGIPGFEEARTETRMARGEDPSRARQREGSRPAAGEVGTEVSHRLPDSGETGNRRLTGGAVPGYGEYTQCQ